MKVMLPTLGEERRATYSPFLAHLAELRTRALCADEIHRRQSRDDYI